MSDSAAPKIIIKHRHTDAVLYEYQPTDEQQESGLAMRAALETATKDGAYLDGANLDGANLRGAYLDGANLRGANLGGKTLIGDRPAFTLGPIGSRCDYFTAYLTDKGIYLRAGCFFGTVAEFVDKLEREHGTNEHGREYRVALALIECHARLWTPDASASQAEATAETVEA